LGMVRTQIQLTEEQVRRLREVARRERVSVAEVIRRCVDRALAEGTLQELYRRAEKWVGGLSARGPADLSTGHDRYLDDAFLAGGAR